MPETMTPPPRTAGRRTLRFETPAAVLADVAVLRRGHARVGRWTLAQACQHLATVIGGNLTPPPTDAPPTAEQSAMKEKFFGLIRGGMPEGMPLAPEKCPPATCGEAEVDALAEAFAALAAYPHATLMVGRCGPVPVEEVRDLHLYHAAHHLSFLTPTTVRRAGLRYGSVDDAIADVERLRKGYVRSGNWTLPQTCWHLRVTAEGLAANPMAEPTPEMVARRPALETVLAGGPLPDGLPAPDRLLPPATADEAEIDAYLALLHDRNRHPPGPAMHRLFGPITGEQVVTLSLAHAAHHLSYIVPTGN